MFFPLGRIQSIVAIGTSFILGKAGRVVKDRDDEYSDHP
jgi:hypothetical protein